VTLPVFDLSLSLEDFIALPAFLMCDFIFSEFASESEADDRTAFAFLGIAVVLLSGSAESKSSIRTRSVTLVHRLRLAWHP
jgi:hypothetical protein